MNVFAAFDGHSGGQTALKVMGIKPVKYYASEVDKYAIQATMAVFPKNERQGDYIKCTSTNSRIKDITEDDRGYRPNRGDKAKSGISELGRILKISAKHSDCLTSNHAPKIEIQSECLKNIHYRKLTPRECGRLQTIPEDILDTLLSAGISNSQLYRMFGNGWTIDVIAHIFSQMDLPIQASTRQLNLFEGNL